MAISRRPARYAGKRAPGPADSARGAHKGQGFMLRVVDGPSAGRELVFDRDEVTIGRVEGNEVVLVEPGISRQHARVRQHAGVYMILDLGSANGTRLNGERVPKDGDVLKDGDYISCGETTLQFCVLEALRGEVTGESRLSETDQHSLDVTGETAPTRRPGALAGWRRKMIALLLLVVGGMALYRYVLRDRLRGPAAASDLSDEPISYSDDDTFFNAVFGLGRWDQTHPQSVLINFEYLGGRVTLQYGAWGVDKVGEVEVHLNRERVGQVPVTMGRWVYGLRLQLPRERLRKGPNQLAFRHTRNASARDEWEICYVQLFQEAIPPPDAKEARSRFDLARKAWEDRDVEPGNAAAALQGFKEARDYLEGLAADKRPELYQEAVDMYERVDRELTRRFQEGLFSARRSEKVDGDAAKAKELLQRTLRFFRKDDFRFRELQRYLDAMSN